MQPIGGIIRRIGINIVLVALFLFLGAATILSFVSEMYFNDAEKLEKTNHWSKARETYTFVTALNPFNAKYPAGLAKFLSRQSAYYTKNRIDSLKQMEDLYQYALVLNPRYAEYASGLGRVQLEMFRQDQEIYKEKLGIGLANLKRALENDPNGFNLTYRTCYAVLPAWSFLDENEKELIASKLRNNLKSRPWHGKYIYPRVWLYAKDFEILRRITPDNLTANEVLLFFLERYSLGQFF
jgi:hypothetical protein